MIPPIDVDMIIDCDTGIDDAFAISLALSIPGLNILAITGVDGNVPIAEVMVNTVGVLDLAGAPDISIARGADRPLSGSRLLFFDEEGTDRGLSIPLPASSRAEESDHAVELLRKTLEAAPRPVTILAIGPLTNIALLLATYPRIAIKIHKLVVMGGAFDVPGNTLNRSEFNFAIDPLAAQIVLAFPGIDIALYPLDVFYSNEVTIDEFATLAASTRLPAQVVGRIASVKLPAHDRDCSAIGDAGALIVALWPELITYVERSTVTVEASDPAELGATTRSAREGAPEVDIVLAADGAAIAARFLEALTGDPSEATDPATQSIG